MPVNRNSIASDFRFRFRTERETGDGKWETTDMKILWIVSMLLPMAAAFACNSRGQSGNGIPATVDSVDLAKYSGKWYEISKIPNRFQRVCAGNTTARYSIRDDGNIDVVNRCKKTDGSTEEAKGIARVVDTNTNAKLKVSFVRFLWRWWFWGDYWIMGLGRDYEYAIVGAPNRKYGWILSRNPEMDSDRYSQIALELKKLGYNPDDFVRTRH